MSIWSVFRQGPERVFAEWMASAPYNESIQVEPFLSPDTDEELMDSSSTESSASEPDAFLERSVRRKPGPSGAGQDELSKLGQKASLDASHPQTDEESPPLQGGVLQKL